MTARRPQVRIGGRNKQLPLADTLPSSIIDLVDALTVGYTSGRVTSVVEDGVTKTITYNADGTVNTVSFPHRGLTRTETYAYTGGVCTGMTAVEV